MKLRPHCHAGLGPVFRRDDKYFYCNKWVAAVIALGSFAKKKCECDNGDPWAVHFDLFSLALFS